MYQQNFYKTIQLESPPGLRFFYELVAVSALVFVLAFTSIVISRIPGNIALLWLPNAAVVAMCLGSDCRKPLAYSVPVLIGISLANIAWGDSPLLAIQLASVNAVEILMACFASKSILNCRHPHLDYRVYSQFIFLVCLVPACLAGLFGATVLFHEFGVPWLTGFQNWVLGDFISLLVFVPFFLLITGQRFGRINDQTLSLRSIVQVFAVFVILMLLHEHLQLSTVLILAVPAACLLALSQNLKTVIFLTAIVLLSVLMIAFLDHAHLKDAFGLASEPLNVALVFVSIALPANLIVIVLEELREAQSKAEESSQLKSEFLSLMSHELRTPLNVITGVFELLEASDQTEKEKRYLGLGRSASSNLNNIIHDVLELSRLEAKAVTLNFESASTTQLLDEWQTLMEAARAKYSEKLAVDARVDDGVPETIVVDVRRLTQVINNLIDNAFRFTESGRIDLVLSYRPSTERIEISVTDTGCGIDPSDHEAIFERFQQVDSGLKREVGGSGLGLAISKDLLDLMGGEILVNSQIDRGSTFTVSIPKLEMN